MTACSTFVLALAMRLAFVLMWLRRAGIRGYQPGGVLQPL
jgi:hypothetical protein